VFEIRLKNSSDVYTVYMVSESNEGNIMFLIYDPIYQRWYWVLADNYVPR
jgi:hypothetical protein